MNRLKNIQDLNNKFPAGPLHSPVFPAKAMINHFSAVFTLNTVRDDWFILLGSRCSVLGTRLSDLNS